MGTNPMQKMKRNSTLTGLTIGLLIGLILCGGVIFVFKFTGAPGATGETIEVCVLSTPKKSGEIIGAGDTVIKKVSADMVPSNATPSVLNGVVKIDLMPGTVLTADMMSTPEEKPKDDLREQEYNMLTLPTNLMNGDFIDIRLQLPNGGDYIVVSKKQVKNCNATNVVLNMYEEEIELMSNAIIEYYIMAGSKLYATKYTDPGMQPAAVGTYVPNQVVAALIDSNPNIKELINSDRYSDKLKAIRNSHINSAVNKYEDEAIDNIETSIKEEIKNLKESRQAYFGALNAAQ